MNPSIKSALMTMAWSALIMCIGSYSLLKVADTRAAEKLIALKSEFIKHEAASKNLIEKHENREMSLREDINKNHKEVLHILRDQNEKLHSLEVYIVRTDERVKRMEDSTIGANIEKSISRTVAFSKDLFANEED